MQQVPLVDLQAQYESIRHEVDEAIAGVIGSAAFIGGFEVRQFEQEFAAYCSAVGGAPSQADLYCASCASGTDALYLTLRALGVGPGDEVITVAHTFIGTSEPISLVGATPIFVDVKLDTLLIDAAAVEAAITPRTRAIVPVHLYGQCCEMDRLAAIAEAHGLWVIEDAAQAHGATWQGVGVGRFGHAACYSFYPGKNLGAYGDGGAVVSKDPTLVERVRKLANHGRIEKYTHEFEGVSSRLDGLQAAVLRAKLAHLPAWTRQRQEVAEQFMRALRGSGLDLPVVHQGASSVWHLFVVRSEQREALQEHLKREGIATGVHYPVPLHRQPAYAHLGYAPGSLPHTEAAAETVLSLPIYPEMTREQVARVVNAVLTTPVLARA